MNHRGVALKAFAVSAFTVLSCLGVCATPSGLEEWCNDIPGLNPTQVDMCANATGLQTAIQTGLMQAVEACENEFKSDPWNCSMLGDVNLLVRAPEGTKEAAFASALTAAGLALHISIACQQGSSPNCSCDVDTSFCRDKASKLFGARFALDFLAAASFSSRSLSYTDQHNAKVGIKALRQRSSVPCALQSDDIESCTPLQKVVQILKQKYLNSRKVALTAGKTALRLKENTKKRAKSGDLVFLNQSPDYCTPNKHAGIAGTQDRVCHVSGNGCKRLCCGRGYSAHNYNVTTPCRARFVIIAGRFVVESDECSTLVSENRCN